MSTKYPHLGGFSLLPPAPDACQECATKHDPELPHNQEALYYHYNFYGQHGRWPTWRDAMEHCTPETRELWTKCLAELGITL